MDATELDTPSSAPSARAAPDSRRRATNGARSPRLRAVAIWTHRYVGLLMAVFLLVAGVTGSFIAFYHELDVLLNPGLYHVAEPAPGTPRLDPFAQREALQRQLPPGLRAYRVHFDGEPGVAQLFEVSSPGSEPAGDDEYFVNPYSGEIIGSRRWGDITQGVRNLLPFMYRLHYSLALGEVGSLLFGIVALLWTIDCFVGGYLTFPPPRAQQGRRGVQVWLKRWKPAWLVRGGQLFSWVFTWHRASGLWVWAMLLVFAWSAVGLNLHQVYDPVTKAVFGLEPWPSDRLPEHEPPIVDPGLDWRDALRRGQALMADQAHAHGFEVEEERRIVYHPNLGAFRYQVRSSLDISDRYAVTTVYFDGKSGELLTFEAPTGPGFGRTLTTWLYQLHFASIRGLGLPYRVFVCVMGLAIAVLSVTGVWIWWVKRGKRLRQQPVEA